MRRRSGVAVLGATLGCVLLSGCLLPPERPEILLSTTPAGASCTLTRLGRPIATAGPTPAIAIVDPSGDPITVTCRRAGFADANVTLPAQHQWPGVATIVYAK